jgi:hypothetical protein
MFRRSSARRCDPSSRKNSRKALKALLLVERFHAGIRESGKVADVRSDRCGTSIPSSAVEHRSGGASRAIKYLVPHIPRPLHYHGHGKKIRVCPNSLACPRISSPPRRRRKASRNIGEVASVSWWVRSPRAYPRGLLLTRYCPSRCGAVPARHADGLEEAHHRSLLTVGSSGTRPRVVGPLPLEPESDHGCRLGAYE